jgi:aminocarboxymuconate-semialdehyde decarboxylase
MANTVGNPAETTIAAAALLFGGVLTRFPALQVVLVHGGGFFPYQLGRLWKAFNVREEVPKGNEYDPLAAVRRFYYDTILHYGPALNHLVEVAGPDRLLFGTDFPFEMAEHRPPTDWIGGALSDSAAFDAVAGDNARKLFGLPARPSA